jgi:hypothetical protein
MQRHQIHVRRIVGPHTQTGRRLQPATGHPHRGLGTELLRSQYLAIELQAGGIVGDRGKAHQARIPAPNPARVHLQGVADDKAGVGLDGRQRVQFRDPAIQPWRVCTTLLGPSGWNRMTSGRQISFASPGTGADVGGSAGTGVTLDTLVGTAVWGTGGDGSRLG